jgi:hypothetical protein
VNILLSVHVVLKILYLKQSLVDYNIKLSIVPLLCDNESAVKIAKNPVLHSRTKHIDIFHHFLREKEANGDIALQMLDPKSNWRISSQNP